MPLEKWMCSDNEESWNDGPYYPFREEAIANAKKDLGLNDNDYCYVGRSIPYTKERLAEAISGEADNLLERVNESVDEAFSQEEFTIDMRADDLQMLILDWVYENGPKNFWTVEDVEICYPK